MFHSAIYCSLIILLLFIYIIYDTGLQRGDWLGGVMAIIWAQHKNTKKTKEMIIAFRKSKTVHHKGIKIFEEEIEWLYCVKYLQRADLKTWPGVQTQQVSIFFENPETCQIPPEGPDKLLLLHWVSWHTAAQWNSSCPVEGRKDFKPVVKTGQWIIGSPLPHLEDF